ncbi:MAG: ABC transporter permease [Roseiflexaceae bacterium]
MRLFRLLLGIMAISVQRELAHRANLLFEATLAAFGAAAGLLALRIVYAQVEALAGWRLEEAIVLLGMYQLISGLLATFVEPNLAWFANKVISGELDDLLLKPAPSLFTASLGMCQPWALLQVGLGAAIVVAGVAPLGAQLTAAGVASALLLLLAGAVITWASRVLLASLAFWAPGVEPTVLYSAFWQLGRYPVDVYSPAVRGLLTYLVPVAFISSIPARSLTRGADLPLLAVGLGAALGSALLAYAVWRLGLRRYTSATS